LLPEQRRLVPAYICRIVLQSPLSIGTNLHELLFPDAWSNCLDRTTHPTLLAYGDWLFLWSDQGIATCLDRASGKIVWQQRIGGNFYSSPICIDGRVYCIDLDGVMVVIAAAGKYEELARISLEQPTSATPAVSNGTLFIRTESHVFSLGGK
jgi:outer membrane protein assembly factor BamB